MFSESNYIYLFIYLLWRWQRWPFDSRTDSLTGKQEKALTQSVCSTGRQFIVPVQLHKKNQFLYGGAYIFPIIICWKFIGKKWRERKRKNSTFIVSSFRPFQFTDCHGFSSCVTELCGDDDGNGDEWRWRWWSMQDENYISIFVCTDYRFSVRGVQCTLFAMRKRQHFVAYAFMMS